MHDENGIGLSAVIDSGAYIIVVVVDIHRECVCCFPHSAAILYKRDVLPPPPAKESMFTED
jgi:hypothetical protein